MYTSEQAEELKMEAAGIPIRTRQFMLALPEKKFTSPLAKEYLYNGYTRRLTTIARCVENVFRLLPPDYEAIPSKELLKDTEISIQSFTFNLFGAVDNLAWIWVEESELRKANGKKLAKPQIGFNSRCELVRNSLSPEFRARLAEFDEWYAHLEDFRHTLAHRIPLYIPPYCVDPKNKDLFEELERDKSRAVWDINLPAYKKAEAAQAELSHFQPFITHSISEQAGRVPFHAQLIADFNTLDDISDWLFREIIELHKSKD